MRDSQNKDGIDVGTNEPSAKDGNCSTPSPGTEGLRALSPTFHTSSSTPRAEPAASSAVPGDGTGDQGTGEQVGEGVQWWCALCGEPGCTTPPGKPCPDRRRSERQNGHRWCRHADGAAAIVFNLEPVGHKSGDEAITWLRPRREGEPQHFAAPANDDWTKPTNDEERAYHGKAVHVDWTERRCLPGKVKAAKSSARGLYLVINNEDGSSSCVYHSTPGGTDHGWHDIGEPGCCEAKAPEPAEPAGPRWCMFCGATAGRATPGRCDDPKAEVWYEGTHHFVRTTEEATRFWLERGAPEASRPLLAAVEERQRKLAHVRMLGRLAVEYPPERRRPHRERPPPVGMVESVLRASQAIDQEHWQDADDALTETMVHLRAAAVLFEGVAPPGEMLRLRAKIARASFAADFLADELEGVRALVRREAAKGRAS